MKFKRNVDYDNAPSITASNDYFEMKAANNKVCFTMKGHFPTEIEARKIVDDFLRNWEIIIGLEDDPDNITFEFERAEIIDLEPDPNNRCINLRASICAHAHCSDDVTVHMSYVKYPIPLSSFSLSPDVETMYMRYKAYREGRDKLLSMAYLILTIVQSNLTRREASNKYKIQKEILDKLGDISSTRGDEREARKAPKDGIFKPLTSNEREWIISACKLLMKRLGEYEQCGADNLSELNMDDLPLLEYTQQM